MIQKTANKLGVPNSFGQMMAGPKRVAQPRERASMRFSKVVLLTGAAALLLAAAGCDQQPPAAPVQPATAAPGARPKKTYQDLVVGYAQIGAESEWRTANTASVKEAAAQLGVELKFVDGQQKQ
jgi:ABC-type sugar transport system substrate-binding protein